MFDKAQPGDTATTDRLGWLTVGMLREQHLPSLSPAVPETPHQSAIGELWIELGRLIERWNVAENKAVGFSGPVTAQVEDLP